MSHTIARTNYVLVKDIEALRVALPEDLDIEVTEGQMPEVVGKVALIMENGLPTSFYNEETEEDEDFDVVDLLAEHLVAGQIAVFQQVGNDKMRYLTGHATAVTHTGERVEVSLDDIYTRAAEAFQTDLGSITDASY